MIQPLLIIIYNIDSALIVLFVELTDNINMIKKVEKYTIRPHRAEFYMSYGIAG
tara:strand:+ start:158 stop:319 length:162 start_codon:yes stop_codon:yes gene_type:complete